MDSHQVGQVVISALIVAGYVINQWQAKAAAKKVSEATHEEADKVATKLEASNQEQTARIKEIHILVNGKLEAALKKIEELEAKANEAKE